MKYVDIVESLTRTVCTIPGKTSYANTFMRIVDEPTRCINVGAYTFITNFG